MDINQLKTRLGRNGVVFVAGALLIFIDSFLPWYTVSVKGGTGFPGAAASTSGWNSGFGGWFSVVILVAAGVIVVLAAMEIVKWTPVMTWTVAAAAGILGTLVILLRWLTYPSPSGFEKAYVDAGAGFGTYLALIIALAMAVFGYLEFTAKGGDIKNPGAAFKSSSLPPSEG